MSGRMLGVLALAAAIAIVAAVMVSRSTGRAASKAEAPSGSVLAPQLRASLGEVAGVRIADAEASIDLRRDADGVWRAASMGGMPAKGEAVTRLIMTVANLDPGEPKTDDASRYAEIGVEDPPAHPDAAKIEFLSADGETIVAVVFGKLSERVIGDRFVRIASDARARLVRVPLVLKPTMREWVELGITRIAPDRIASVSVQPIDAAPVVVEREDPAGSRIVVIDAPPDREADVGGAALTALFGALAWLDMEGARASDSGSDPPSAVTTTYRLREGWSIEVRTWADGEGTWAMLGVFDPPSPLEGDDAEFIRQEMEALRERIRGWDFRIAGPRYESFRPTMDTLTRPRTGAQAPAP